MNVPGTTVAILSRPSKMKIRINDKLTQIYSFGLRAGVSCPGATYDTNHKCSGCYARKGRYSYPTARKAQDIRTEWTMDSMETRDKRKAWIDILKKEVEWATVRRNVEYFRLHHGGDFFSAAYIDSWHEIIEDFPTVKFWGPTSSHLKQAHPKALRLLNEMQPALLDLATEPNAIIRPSPRLKGVGNILEVDGLAAGTGVITRKELKELETLFGINICPAKQNGNVCGDCTACWDEPLIGKYYPDH
jgi:hypothetical protein